MTSSAPFAAALVGETRAYLVFEIDIHPALFGQRDGIDLFLAEIQRMRAAAQGHQRQLWLAMNWSLLSNKQVLALFTGAGVRLLSSPMVGRAYGLPVTPMLRANPLFAPMFRLFHRVFQFEMVLERRDALPPELR